MSRRALAMLVAGSVSLAAAADARAGRRLNLAELTRRARAGPRAEAARFATRAAEGRITEARGARFPRLELRALVAPSPDISCLDDACTTTSPQEPTLALDGLYGGLDVTLYQPLFTFGKLAAAERGARHAAAALKSAEAAVAGDIEVEAARAYYGLKLAREMTAELEDGVAALDTARRQVAEQLAAGRGSVTVQDRLRLDTVMAEARIRLAEAAEAEATALAAVRALAGDPTGDIDSAPLEPDAIALEPAARYAERALAGRSELAALRHAAAGAGSLADLEKARFLPDFLLLGTVNWARAGGVDNPPSAFARDPYNTTGAGVVAALRWNLEPFGQAGRLAAARARQGEAGAQLRAAGEAVRVDVARAHAQAQGARAKLEAAADGEKSARGWVASVLQGEAIGVVEARELADAYVAYFALRARYLQAVHDWNLAVVRLRRASGESGPGRGGGRP
ncbi:MAG TPA: TolC family protein [Kofleriaceae bacterium]|nr:TolC family protein [Kofleriaceae bacterium]